MSEEIRILEIETENYRQYGEINTIKFPEDEKGFSVIIGENGAGKSNILNAINWCFYKKEPHQKKNQGKIIINDTYLKNLEIGHYFNMPIKNIPNSIKKIIISVLYNIEIPTHIKAKIKRRKDW